MAGARAFSAQGPPCSCAAAHISGSTYFESLFSPTIKATQGGQPTEVEVSSAIRYFVFAADASGGRLVRLADGDLVAGWLCDVPQRATIW